MPGDRIGVTLPTKGEIRHRWKMCSRKKSYDSKTNAENSKEVRRHGHRIYKCPYCRGWHATHLKEETNPCPSNQ